MTTGDLRSDLRAFILDRFPQADFRDDENIFELGFINSLFSVELVMFVEATLGVEVPNDDLTLENFESITSILALVARLRGVEPAMR